MKTRVIGKTILGIFVMIGGILLMGLGVVAVYNWFFVGVERPEMWGSETHLFFFVFVLTVTFGGGLLVMQKGYGYIQPKREEKPKVKWSDLPLRTLDRFLNIPLFVEELQLFPSKFSPSGRQMTLKLRSAAGINARGCTDSTLLILYFQNAKLPLKGHFTYRPGSMDIEFIPT